MFNLKKILVVAVFAALLFPTMGQAAGKPVELYFFEGQGCSYCARMKSFLEGVKADYPNLEVREFEIYFNKENQVLFERMAKAYGATTSGVPTLFIGEEVISGADFEKVKNAVEKCSAEGCLSPAEKLKDESPAANTNSGTDNTNQQTSSGPDKNELVGWIVIGLFSAAGIGFIIYILKAKQ